jgi:hypothetical protein
MVRRKEDRIAPKSAQPTKKNSRRNAIVILAFQADFSSRVMPGSKVT